ncbi:hypothetical protein [Pseudonocardia lacus]|uniref:hypothetical protein n=1 Tax=Pseudonocardia lacus TaxID=2835865 RepID=UPI001BDC5C86|nr:hypothetical protein [Pseudonocardia lacus]
MRPHPRLPGSYRFRGTAEDVKHQIAGAIPVGIAPLARSHAAEALTGTARMEAA